MFVIHDKLGKEGLMPHQDTDHSSTNAQDLQEALDWLIPQDTLADIAFRDQSVWTPFTLIYAALMWSWSAKTALTKRFAEARKTVVQNAADEEQPGKSYTGFLKRLAHWSGRLKERMMAEFHRTMREDLKEGFLVAGWLLLAGDGSRVLTPRTHSNEQAFSAKKKAQKKKRKTTPHQKRLAAARRRKQKRQSEADRRKKANTPQIWLTMLYHVGLGLPWDWRQGPSDSSERAHVLDMAKHLPEKSLIAIDAGFVGYNFWRTLDQSGTAFVARIGSNVRLLKNLGYVRREKDIVYVWPDQARRMQKPPLVLRLYQLTEGREDVYLVTNVLEEDRLSSSHMRDIYQARWGIETYYRDFKQTFGRKKLLSKTAPNARLELDWSILGLWAICLYGTAQQIAQGIKPNRRSVANLLHAFRLTLEQPKCPADDGEDLFTLITRAVKDTYKRTSSKTSRNHPRKKTKHAIGKPIIRNATTEQLSDAKNIKTAL
jgi:hypothetical protein